MGNTLLHTNFWSNRTIDSCFMYFRVLCFLLCSPFDEPDIVILVIENPSQASTLCFLEVKLGATSDCLCAWLIEKVAKLIGKVCSKGRYSSTFFCRCANPVGHFSRCPPAVSCRQVVGLGWCFVARSWSGTGWLFCSSWNSREIQGWDLDQATKPLRQGEDSGWIRREVRT